MVLPVAVILAIALLAWWLLRAGVPTEKLILADGSQPIAAPVYVAFAKGYFKDEGVDIQLLSFQTGKACVDAVLGGNAQFATAAETPVMHTAFKGLPVKIVATIHRSRQNTFCVARKDKGITVPSDLKGKRVGVTQGTNAEYAFETFLEHNKLRQNEMRIINLNPPEMLGPLGRGDVEAVVSWQPHIGRCEHSLGQDATAFYFSDIYEETYNIVSSDKMTTAHKDTVVRVLRALNNAMIYMSQHENRAEVVNIVATRIGMDAQELNRLWEIYHFGLDLRRSLLDTLTSEGRWALRSGQQSGSLPDMQTVISTAALREVLPQAVDLP